MKALNGLLLLLVVILFFSCKKDDSPAPSDTVSSDDPAALSRSIKIWHGQRETGTIPAPNGNGPMIVGPDAQQIFALGGKFAVVQPMVLSGDVKGYYVKINGAPDYFDVDYSQPRESGRLGTPGRRINLLNRPDSIPPGPQDSSIVLILPPNIQMPDTFCITYYPYDSLYNVGTPATSCIIVTQLGGDANSSWLQGGWRITGIREDMSMPGYDTIIYNSWQASTWGSEYYCLDYGTGSYLSNYCDPAATCTLLNIRDSVLYSKMDLLMNSNGGLVYHLQESDKFVDMSSPCNAVSWQQETFAESINGGWSLSGNTLTLIFQFDDYGTPMYDAWQYRIEQIDNNSFKLVDTYDPAYPISILFKRI